MSQTAHLTGLEDMLRDRMAMLAKAGGRPEGRLAEAFSVFSTV